MVLRDTSPLSSEPTGLNKVGNPGPTPCGSIPWPVRQQAEQAWSLDSILLTIEEEPTWPSRGRTWTNLKNNESCSVGNDWGLKRKRSWLTLSFPTITAHITSFFNCHPNPLLQERTNCIIPFSCEGKIRAHVFCLEPGTKYLAYMASKYRSTGKHKERTSTFFCFEGPYRLL